MKSTNNNRRKFIKLSLLGSVAGVVAPFRNFAHTLSEIKREFLTSKQDVLFVDNERIRSLFPLDQRRRFFNVASHSVISYSVIKKITDTLTHFATTAVSVRRPMDYCKKELAEWLTTDAQNIALTRNTTESANILARGLDLRPSDEVLLTTHEHIGGAAPWLALSKENRVKVKSIDLDLSGKDNLETIRQNITPKTKVIFVSHITCTTGLRLPVEEIVKLCKTMNIISCIDGAQAIGMIPVNLKQIDPDFYIGCGHKWLFGPKGTGILYAKNPSSLSPLFVGSYSDAAFDIKTKTLDYQTGMSKLEYGTRNVASFAGLKHSLDFLKTIGTAQIEKHGLDLAQYVENQLTGHDNIVFLSPTNTTYKSSILTLRFTNLDNKNIVKTLFEKHDIWARWVYECELDAIRFSFSIINSKKEADDLIFALKELHKNGGI